VYHEGFVIAMPIGSVPEAVMQLEQAILDVKPKSLDIGLFLLAAAKFVPSQKQILERRYFIKNIPMNPPPDGIFVLPIFHKHYGFLLALHGAVGRFPKHDRYALGVRVEQLGLEVLSGLVRANAVRGFRRAAILQETSVSLDILKVMLRLAKDGGAVPDKSYLTLMTPLIEVGRMLGGWIKSSGTNRPTP
jgi:hypothetical protein